MDSLQAGLEGKSSARVVNAGYCKVVSLEVVPPPSFPLENNPFGSASSQTGQSETWQPAPDRSCGQRQMPSTEMEMFCLVAVAAVGVFLTGRR